MKSRQKREDPLRPLSVGAGLIADRFQFSDTVLRHQVG
jgi:hypothetical protein